MTAREDTAAAGAVRTQAIVQARMGSTRLPGKVLIDICGRPVLWHVVNRLRRARSIDRVIVATTDLPEDDVVYEAVIEWGVGCVRGDSADVLARYETAAAAYPCEAVARVTADCPIIDPAVCDETTAAFWASGYRYMSNQNPSTELRTFPRGLDYEIFSRDLLAEASALATEEYEREHVTPYMYWKNSSVGYYVSGVNRSDLRWTLDTPDDLKLIKAIYEALWRGEEADPFSWLDVIDEYGGHPEWTAINAHIVQKEMR